MISFKNDKSENYYLINSDSFRLKIKISLFPQGLIRFVLIVLFDKSCIPEFIETVKSSLMIDSMREKFRSI
jgi:hypothetical protein